MVNPTSALIPNQPATVNVPNTNPGVTLIGANAARNGLMISNASANIIWIGPSTVVFTAGTQVQGSFALPVAATIMFGAMSAGMAAAGILIPWVWSAAMTAQAAAGATNIVTVLEF